MSSPPPAIDPTVQGKKRKRTGKEREERKRLAIQAQLEAKQTADAIVDPVVAEAIPDDVQAEVTPVAIFEDAKKEEVDIEKTVNRIPQALKSLHPVFKQAKSFETRRLIKKIKFLRTKPDAKVELTDLESQLTILHDIQLHSLIQSHLLVKLRKHPLFKQSALPTSITDLLNLNSAPVSTSSTSATPALVEKVENRLCSAKNVAEAVKSTLSWIVREDGAKLIPHSKKDLSKLPVRNVGKIGKNAHVEDDVESDEEQVRDRREMIIESDIDLSDGDDDEGGGGIATQDYAADEAGWESGSIGGANSDSEEEDEDEEGSDEDEDSIPLPSNKKSKLDSTTTTTKTQTKEKPTKPSKVEKIPSKGDITSSMFLPSLSTGFTRGDEGDSDPDEDYDVDGVIGKQGVVRKNRRGQRARQAIWEKKFGKGAKHVVKAREDEDSYQASKAKREAEKRGKPIGMHGRDGGWGPRTGSTATTTTTATATANPKSAPPQSAARVNPPSRYTAPSSAAPPKEEQKNLHPSWEAARLRKQKMEAIPANAPKASKIVFD
ncbi:uncharacterized protein IL334_002425 [Kwoniella shivajii]|uniref:Bud22 domain-containing protein n=1 Tax=Kwoniella shivajii TaxID=564305 RepID=A0ABZ1CUP9_9TREE|nr:hypothetical protein IL334_002425 [Kwoniella shivajii]